MLCLHCQAACRLHTAETGASAAGKPLMLLVHGFPEMWYSWRHQLQAFEATHHVVAVDLRGYGQSSCPKVLACSGTQSQPVWRLCTELTGGCGQQGSRAYQMDQLVGDISGLIAVLGYTKCILVAHDWCVLPNMLVSLGLVIDSAQPVRPTHLILQQKDRLESFEICARGGNIAWHLAALQPQLIEKLVILGTPHPKAYEDKTCFTSQQQKRYPLICFMMMGSQSIQFRTSQTIAPSTCWV